MGSAQGIAGAALIAAAAFGLGTAAPAAADEDYAKYAMNGRFSVVSNGEWARQNDRYQDEPSVRSEWTVSSTCTTALTCSGTVTSTLGWTEPIYTGTGNLWFVKHYVNDWLPCPKRACRSDPRTCGSARTRRPASAATAAATGPW